MIKNKETESNGLSFEGAERLIFCDETKFYKRNGDIEDAIFYFGIAVKTEKCAIIDSQLKKIFQEFKLQAATFHASKNFGPNRPRGKMMVAICDLIINNQLQCYCFKYSTELLFQASTQLNYLNDDIIDFNSVEFQALFYFLISLNTRLRDDTAQPINNMTTLYFDRNVYGTIDIEAFKFPSDLFVIKRMTFSEKSLISLLALPDFFGYIFRKTKENFIRDEIAKKILEKSQFIENCNSSVLKIHKAGLFHFLDFDPKNLELLFSQEFKKPNRPAS